MIQTPISDFFRQNFFGLVNLLALVCGLAYFSGQLQSSVTQENTAIAAVQRQLQDMESLNGQTVQNTSDISRIRVNEDVVSQQLLQISTQISGLTQWVKDHHGNLGGSP